MKQMVDLYKKILDTGEVRGDRTGVGTISIFGGQIEFDLRDHFPLLTIKKTLYKSAFTEMLWFLRAEPNIKYLKDRNIPIWDAWADKDGNLGPVYGVQWRKWPGRPYYTHRSTGDQKLTAADLKGKSLPFLEDLQEHRDDIDQIKGLIERIKSKPEDRRLIVTAWNPTFIDIMGLPPCHRDFQCYVSNDGHLDLMMAIRSWDTALGGPFNVAQYALLTHLIARATGLKPRMLKINYGDAHIYSNHVDAMRTLVDTVQPFDCKPQLVIKTDNIDIDGYQPEDFEVVGYESGPMVKLPVAV